MRTSCSAHVLLLLVTCSCNRAFGIHETEPIDAQVFDVGTDAALLCPSFGTAPTFSPTFRQVLLQDCAGYTVSETTGRAMASCNEVAAIEEGAVDAPLMPSPEFQLGMYRDPRLGPDGNIAILESNSTASATVFHRDDAGWTATTTLPLATASISEPTRGPNMRVLVITTFGEIHELVDNGADSWTDDATTSLAQLGVTSAFARIHLSPDGLRVVFTTAATELYYADRVVVTDAFTNRGLLQHVPTIGDAFMTEDCGRLYFSTLNSVWLSERD